MKSALIFTTFLLRVFGSFLDGSAGRGRLSRKVFHILNWMRRDVVIVIIYFYTLRTWQEWVVAAMLHYVLHQIAYRLGEVYVNKRW